MPRREFKTILYQKLSSKTASQIVASIDRDEYSYEELKQTLIESLGSGKTSLGSKLTTAFSNDVRSMNPLEKYVHLKSLIDSVNMSIVERKDILLFFASAIYRNSLTSQQKAIMDSQEINTFRDLNKLALSWNSTDSDRPGGSRVSGHGTYFDGVKCFKCQRFGHKSFECRVNREESRSIVCYTCQQPGHKSPDCPNKGERAPAREQSRQTEWGKRQLGLKAGNKPLTANWVSVQDGTPVVSGCVNGFKCDIVPETGAEVTVVPGCLVYENQILPDTIEVWGATGVPVTLCMAVVDFDIEGRIFEKCVAIARQGMLNNKVLFSVPVDSTMAKRLLLGAAPLLSKTESGVGHSGDTPDAQLSPKKDAESAGSTDGVVDALQTATS